MKLHLLFRGGRGNQTKNQMPSPQSRQTQPAIKALTQQELEQVQGGVEHEQISITRASDKPSSL